MHEGPATTAGELNASTTAQLKKSSILKAWPNYAKIEKTLGGLKFAVTLILLFSLAMTVGTFLESYYGTDFASRLVYKRWPFMLVQFLMLISIIFAVFLRLPPKKRLYGFYTIHTGLVTIWVGAFITWYSGVDGAIQLFPNEPARTVILNKDILRIRFPGEDKIVTKALPYTAFETTIDESYEELHFGRFIPYAQFQEEWKEAPTNLPAGQGISSEYIISNPNVTQKFTLSLHPNAIDYESSLAMGLLNINYLPVNLGRCFSQHFESRIILWDGSANSCETLEEKGLTIQKTSSGNRFFVLKEDGETLAFFPDVSPWPMDGDFKVIQGHRYRVFSKSLFEEKPHLFLFGHELAYFDKDSGQWTGKTFAKMGDTVDLPWMGFEFKLLKHSETSFPVKIPEYILPIQKNSELVRGQAKALEVNVRGESYWVTDTQPLGLMIDGKRVQVELSKESLDLPFEFVLTRFKMDTDPGTNNPASYESFVKLFTREGPQEHHIYMNNPLKHAGFTFYQASYTPLQNGGYASTLSANVDQGRALKYLGSLLVVLGAIWHYVLNRSRYHSQGLKKGSGHS